MSSEGDSPCRRPWIESTTSSSAEEQSMFTPDESETSVVNHENISSATEESSSLCLTEQEERQQTQETAPRPIRHRGRAQRGCRRPSARSTRGDEEDFQVHINTKVLIHLVKARPPLWDQSHPSHRDHIVTRRLWEEVSSELVNSWKSLSNVRRRKCAEKISARWGSIRNRFLRDVQAEQQQHFYDSKLQFLRPLAERRQSSSSSPEPAVPGEAVTKQPQMGNTIPHTSAQKSVAPLAESSASSVTFRAYINASFGEFLRRGSSAMRRPRELDDLARLIRDSLLRLDEKIIRNRDEMLTMIRRSEGSGPSSQPTANHQFLLSLLPWMEQMTLEQTQECRTALAQIVWEILHRPPAQSYPHTQSYPATDSHDIAHSHPPSQPHGGGQFHPTSQPHAIGVPQSISYPPPHSFSSSLPTPSAPRTHHLPSFSDSYPVPNHQIDTPGGFPRSGELFKSAIQEQTTGDSGPTGSGQSHISSSSQPEYQELP